MLPGVTAISNDADDRRALVQSLRGHETVISAIKFRAVGPDTLISAVKEAGAARYIVVGGAGSLLNNAGTLLVNTPAFPESYKPEALAGTAFLERLRAEPELNWTFLSPAFVFAEGERTGHFRLGGDTALTTEQGPTRISFGDYAIALVDEIERPAHHRQRFSVAY